MRVGSALIAIGPGVVRSGFVSGRLSSPGPYRPILPANSRSPSPVRRSSLSSCPLTLVARGCCALLLQPAHQSSTRPVVGGRARSADSFASSIFGFDALRAWLRLARGHGSCAFGRVDGGCVRRRDPVRSSTRFRKNAGGLQSRKSIRATFIIVAQVAGGALRSHGPMKSIGRNRGNSFSSAGDYPRGQPGRPSPAPPSPTLPNSGYRLRRPSSQFEKARQGSSGKSGSRAPGCPPAKSCPQSRKASFLVITPPPGPAASAPPGGFRNDGRGPRRARGRRRFGAAMSAH